MGQTTVSVYVGDSYLQNVISSGSTIFTNAYQVDSWTSKAGEIIYVADNGASTITETLTATDAHVILPSSVLGGTDTIQQFSPTATTQTAGAATASGPGAVQTGHSGSIYEQKLSSGAIAAIAVCIPVVILATLGIGAIFMIRYRRRHRTPPTEPSKNQMPSASDHTAFNSPPVSELHGKYLPHEVAGTARHELQGESSPSDMGAGVYAQRYELQGGPLPSEVEKYSYSLKGNNR